jgi:hypothetical protein
MIVNLYSIFLLFVDGLCVVLMTWGAVACIKLLKSTREVMDEEKHQVLEGRSYLLLLIACVVLMLRLIGWPFFYLVLWSFVPDITGAMCIFGVTQVKPILTGTLEVMKPFSFFLFGAWLFIHTLDHATKRADLLKNKLLMLSFIAPLVIIECMMEMWLIINISPTITVSCCTTVTDLLNRPTRVIPTSVFGKSYGLYIEVGFWVVSLLVIGIMMVLLWVRPLEKLRRRRLWLGFVAGISMIVAPSFFILAMIETIAPRLMKLPFHHCLYCLWQYVPYSILIFLLFVTGIFAPIWAFLLEILGKKGEAAVMLPVLLRKLYLVGILSMGLSIALLGTHHLLLIVGLL